MKKIARTAAPIVLAGLLIFGLAIAVSAQNRDIVGTLIARVLTVQNSATINGPAEFNAATTFNDTATFAAAASLTTLNVSGNADVTGNLEVVDHLLTQAEFYMIPPAVLTVTNASTITPTGAVMELTAAGAVGAELAMAGDGQFLILINTVNQTITISETSAARMAGDFAMGQYDTITFIGQGITWHEVARSNN